MWIEPEVIAQVVEIANRAGFSGYKVEIVVIPPQTATQSQPIIATRHYRPTIDNP